MSEKQSLECMAAETEVLGENVRNCRFDPGSNPGYLGGKPLLVEINHVLLYPVFD
jgi:hypothetical protein